MTRCNMKLLTCVFAGGVLIAFDTWSMQCEKYDVTQLAALSDQEKESFVATCTVVRDESTYDSNHSQPIVVAWEEDSDDGDGEFWDNWAGFSDSPVLSSKSDSAFYGLGVWLPDKYDDFDILTLEDAQEWIRSHGVQMSFGVGGGDGNSPRLRFDYRWHDDNLDNIFLQVEIPFQ
ncbi:hypothetical protein MD588_11245 [Photobacterium sp. SDRW27]|uniref:hypothetical protein n=1 Tax=Photobacterium obscurum TaxID=2829490 RepID=UPI002243AB55|nr:hypothetical protein [Photobacterium obscurum]MCW8329383.1 hypothetical protein [Photobacterium obscurum]